jgi:hypothetical protein
MDKCLNCGETISGSYCSNCGQSTDIKRYSSKYFFSELKSITDFDVDFFRTFKSMLTRPGKFIHKYLIGIRKNYNSPLKYLFIVLAINFALAFFLGKPAYEPVKVYTNEQNLIIDQLIVFLTNLFTVLFMIPLAYGILLINKKESFVFLEYFAFMIFIISNSILLSILVQLLLKIFSVPLPEILRASIWVAIFSITYFWSYLTFFGAEKKNKFFSFILSYITGIFLLAAPLAAIGFILKLITQK